jgi:hypothetical protein
MSDAEIVPVGTALDVIFRLREPAREAMAECLRKELDPPINATILVMLEGLECIATVLSNGWTAVYREVSNRDIFHLLGTKTLVLYDLLDPESAITSGLGLGR